MGVSLFLSISSHMNLSLSGANDPTIDSISVSSSLQPIIKELFSHHETLMYRLHRSNQKLILHNKKYIGIV